MTDPDVALTIDLKMRDLATAELKEFNRHLGVSERTGTRSFKKQSKAAQDYEKDLKRMVAQIGGVGAALAALRGGAQEFLGLDRALSEIGTITDFSSEGLEDLRSQLEGLALQLGEDPTQLAKGYYQAISAGAEQGAEAMDVLTAAAELAIAGVAETGQTVDVLTDVLNAYQLEASASAEVSDQLFATVRVGKTTISELSTGLARSIPLAASLGVEFSQLGASVATITAGGAGSTSQASTLVGAVLTSLSRNFEGIQKAVRASGEEFSLADIKAQGLVPTLQKVRDAVQGDQVALTELLGSQESVRAVLALTGPNLDTYAEKLQAIEESAGSTAEALDKQLGSSAKELDILFQGLKQGVADVAGEFITGFLGVDRALEDTQLQAERLKESFDGLAEVAGLVGQGASGAATGAGFFSSSTVEAVKGLFDVITSSGEESSEALRETRHELERIGLEAGSALASAGGFSQLAQNLSGAATLGDATKRLEAMEKLLANQELMNDYLGDRNSLDETSRLILGDLYQESIQLAQEYGATLNSDVQTAVEGVLGLNKELAETLRSEVTPAAEEAAEALRLSLRTGIPEDVVTDVSAAQEEFIQRQLFDLRILELAREEGFSKEKERLERLAKLEIDKASVALLQGKITQDQFAEFQDARLVALERELAGIRELAAAKRDAGITPDEIGMAESLAATYAQAAVSLSGLAIGTEQSNERILRMQLELGSEFDRQRQSIADLEAEWLGTADAAAKAGLISRTQMAKELQMIKQVIAVFRKKVDLQEESTSEYEKNAIAAQEYRDAVTGNDFGEGFAAEFENLKKSFSAGAVGADAAQGFFQTMSSGFDQLAVDIARSQGDFDDFVDSMKQQLTALALSSLFKFAFGSALGANTAAAAEGGMMHGRMLGMVPISRGAMGGLNTVPMKAYSEGGVATQPTLALFGEGNSPGGEAFVPLGGDRRIPVRLEGPPPSSRGEGLVQNITVPLTINSPDPRGFKELLASESRQITDIVADAAASGSSRRLVDAIQRTARG